MIIESCTCNPIPVHSSYQDEKDCMLVDGIDEEGNRYHGYQSLGKEPRWLTMIIASPNEQARQNKINDEHMIGVFQQRAKETRRDELKDKMKSFQLSLEEIQELLMMLV